MPGLTATRPEPPGAPELDALVALARKGAQGQAEAFTARLQQALDAAIDNASDIEQQEAARHAATALRKKPREFQRLLATSLQESLRQAIGVLVDSGVSPLESGAMDLSASTFEAMQDKVLLENLAGAIDKLNAAALDALGPRIGLLLGREPGAAAHPFRAATFLSAALDAWRRFDFDAAACRAVLRQFRPEVFLQLDIVLESLNQMLAAAAPQDAGAQQEPLPKPAPRRRRGDSMLGKLQQWLAPRVPSHSKTQRGQAVHPALRARPVGPAATGLAIQEVSGAGAALGRRGGLGRAQARSVAAGYIPIVFEVLLKPIGHRAGGDSNADFGDSNADSASDRRIQR